MTGSDDNAPDLRAEYPEGAVVRVADMGPVERAYTEAEHENCESEPKGHPLSDHEPWSGGDLDGVETWDSFTARLARHGLTLTLAATPSSEPWCRTSGAGHVPHRRGSMADCPGCATPSSEPSVEPGLDAAWLHENEIGCHWYRDPVGTMLGLRDCTDIYHEPDATAINARLAAHHPSENDSDLHPDIVCENCGSDSLADGGWLHDCILAKPVENDSE